jgi:hypothetical protein
MKREKKKNIMWLPDFCKVPEKRNVDAVTVFFTKVISRYSLDGPSTYIHCSSQLNVRYSRLQTETSLFIYS